MLSSLNDNILKFAISGNTDEFVVQNFITLQAAIPSFHTIAIFNPIILVVSLQINTSTTKQVITTIKGKVVDVLV